MAHRRIDVHHHAVPASYAAWLRAKRIEDAAGRALPGWSPEDALRPDRQAAEALFLRFANR